MKNYQWENQNNSTQRVSSIRKNQRSGYMYGTIPEEVINQMAKIRLLQDEVLAQKIKNQTLQRKVYEYIDTIAQLQYTVSDLRIMLQRADNEIKRQLQLDRQLQTYEQNIKQVGQQLKQLNEILQKKNKECQKLIQVNLKLKQQNLQLQNKVKQANAKKQKQKSKIKHLLDILHTQSQPSFNDDMMADIELIQDSVLELKQSNNKSKQTLERYRKQASENLIKQKQKLIQLQYSLKLAQKRNQDLQRKKNLQSSFIIDKKVENIIDQMLKKQQELNAKIVELETEVQQLKSNAQSAEQDNYRIYQLKKKDLEKQLKQAKQTIRELISEKDVIREKFQSLSSIRDLQSSRAVNQQLEFSRKYRQNCQENKRLKLKINQLESDKKMLQKQLSIRSNPK